LDEDGRENFLQDLECLAAAENPFVKKEFQELLLKVINTLAVDNRFETVSGKDELNKTVNIYIYQYLLNIL
jgi:hypothetical protein